MYYNYNEILSYRQPIKAIVGGEGIGKTYGLKERLCEWRKTETFEVGWFIRYDIDITPQYIEEWDKDLPPEVCEKLIKKGREIFYKDGETETLFIRFFALSKYGVGKGIPYPNIKYCVFDEFITDKDSRFLPNEIFAFKRWTQSIFRLRKINWFLLANPLQFDNPYFNYFGVSKREGEQWFKNQSIVVHFPNSKEFKAKVKEADYYKLFNDEHTEKFSLGGEFYFDNQNFVCSKPIGVGQKFNVIVGKEVFGVFKSKQGNYWVSRQPIPNGRRFALTKLDVEEGTLFVEMGKFLERLYLDQRLWFDSLSTKNTILERIKCA